MSRRYKRGLTLVEIFVTLGLVALLALLSLSALNGRADEGKSGALARLLVEEFEATRQLAMRSGQPVALGIPTQSGTRLAACSVYRLQGWNTPYVNWSKTYHSEYSEVAFAAATWDGAPSPGGPPAVPVTAKYFNFGAAELLAWIPDAMEDDYIFCYLPDGSLVTNGLPTSADQYTVTVAEAPSFSGSAPASTKLTAGASPFTLYISPAGGVVAQKGCSGSSLGTGGGAVALAAPQLRTIKTGASQIFISELKIRPNPSGVPGEGICVPGQVVTMELFAHCPQGDALFANWSQNEGTISTDRVGTFTYPNQESTLEHEADRMEFLSADRIPTGSDAPDWGDPSYAPAPGTGIFRARWTWTVPTLAQEGDLFGVTANVQNAQADATIMTPPREIVMNPAPSGRLLVERFDPATGRWELWRMNPDGSGERKITPEGMAEMMPTVDRDGQKMAFLRQGPGGIADRYVMIRPVEGGKEQRLDGPGEFTSVSISPWGRWVAYRNNATDTLVVMRTDGTDRFEKEQTWGGSGYTVKKGRPGWSYNGDFVLYGTDFPAGNPILVSARCDSPGPGRDPDNVVFGRLNVTTSGGIPRMFSPTSYEVGGREYVVMSCSGDDSYLYTFEVVGRDYTVNHNPTPIDPDPNRRPRKDWGSGFVVGSPNMDEDYPSVSPDGTKLTYTTSPTTPGAEDNADQQVVILDNVDGAGVFFGQPPRVLGIPNIRRAIYIPE